MRETNLQYKNLEYNILQNIDANNIIRSKKKILKKYSDTQTKKESILIGSGPFKVKNPLRKSTKKLFKQQRDESHVQKKLYDYQRLKNSVTAYQSAKADLKKAKINGSSKEKIADLKQKKKEAEAHMHELRNGNTYMSTKDILKMAESGIAKYEEKQKYYVESTDKLKRDTIDFIKNRSEYIKNGKPELTKKLDSLATSDHTKMAFIKISGRGPVPVNKLKYSDFNIDNPRVTNAYLDQFKTVNDSITKINKNFDITRLSPERRVELAHELHKITVDGIHDPATQEHHFLKTVTDIAYKDKYYSALDSKSKGASFEYLKAQGPYSQPVDTPEPNLRQKKTILEQKLRKAKLPEYALTEAEKSNIRTEIEYLDKELKQSPETIAKQIREQEKLVAGISKLDPNYEEQRMKLDRLKEHKANIETVKQADFTEDTTIIANEITRLKNARTLLLETGGKINTSIDVNTLSEELNKIGTELKGNPSENRKKILTTRKNRLESVIKRQTEFKNIQATIATLESMTPEAREKFQDELQFKSGDELRALLAKKQSIKKLGTSDQLQDIIQKDITQIEAAIKVQDFKKQINTTPIPNVLKERIKQGITTDMTQNNVNALKDKILKDKELIFRLAKEQIAAKAANATKKQINSKEKLVTISNKVSLSNTLALEKQLESKKIIRARIARQAAKIDKAIAAGKVTPEKATALLKKFETKHIGYIPEDSIKLLRIVASQTTKTPTRSGAIRRNLIDNPDAEPVAEPIKPVAEPVKSVKPVKPVAEPVAEPVAAPVPKPVKPVVEPVAEPIKPVAEPVKSVKPVKPVAEPVAEPVAAPVPKPVKPVVEPVAEPVPKPVKNLKRIFLRRAGNVLGTGLDAASKIVGAFT